ncbi:MAG TPA: hypothetical protein VFG69_10130, partial [Nannocystaceae bacterium]|nr:hypothetical protein [Nannocystaceae bacterium]
MRESVIWGAIVGVVLGVMITFALAHGMFPMPWRSDAVAEPSRPVLRDVESQSAVAPRPDRDRVMEPRRPARPG